MKTLLSILFYLTVVSFAQIDTITILHVNDTHSYLAPIGPRNSDLSGTRGGIARAASIIGLTKMTEQNVLTLHGGDVFAGDIFFNHYYGVAEFRLMNALGFDAMGVGNHEFDLTSENLLLSLDSSYLSFPLISSNLYMDELPAIKNYIQPYTIKEFGNTKIGIFGLTTPEANVFSLPAPVVIDTNIIPITLNIIDSLMSKGCNMIICLSHLGVYYDQMIAQNIPYIDLIISSHDHYKTEIPIEITNPLGKITRIVQTDGFYKSIGKMKLISDNNSISLLEYQIIDLDENIPEEPSVAAVVNDLIAGIESVYGNLFTQACTYSTDYFEEEADSLMFSGKHDTPIGNLITDAFRWKTGTQVAIQVGGSTSQPIYDGVIVPVDLFRVYGYGFNTVNGLGYRLVTFNITGEALWQAFEIALSQIELNDELFPQVSGIEFNYNPNKEPYSRLISLTINGNPIDLSTSYSVTTNEFLHYAISEVFGVPVQTTYQYSDSTEFQVLLDYVLTLGGSISPYRRDNIVAGSKDKGEVLPKEYQLFQNYPNPFNPSTIIEYSVAKPSMVSITVFDITGSEVGKLVNEFHHAGSYSVNFDLSKIAGKTISSNVYFYSMNSGDFSQTKKMIFLK
ncbi:MAG: 5'-nucleotidase C-terminal domain-containing protein [Ignavibacteriaceae bacterium]|nr:5'-nucleotidase C-terminal domain-containing protein [Ignavibacteriaceae bacterium]